MNEQRFEKRQPQIIDVVGGAASTPRVSGLQVWERKSCVGVTGILKVDFGVVLVIAVVTLE
jgi:hypothetical protein